MYTSTNIGWYIGACHVHTTTLLTLLAILHVHRHRWLSCSPIKGYYLSFNDLIGAVVHSSLQLVPQLLFIFHIRQLIDIKKRKTHSDTGTPRFWRQCCGEMSSLPILGVLCIWNGGDGTAFVHDCIQSPRPRRRIVARTSNELLALKSVQEYKMTVRPI